MSFFTNQMKAKAEKNVEGRQAVSMNEMDHWLERLFWIAMILDSVSCDLGWPHCVATGANGIATG